VNPKQFRNRIAVGKSTKRQGTTSQLAEKLFKGSKKCQGTTLVVPQVLQN